MKVVGIIAEYNPFHKGHEYQIRKAKEVTGADYCIVIMSGNFVQRGTPALIDKYSRTHMALSGGADLVLELPVPYACSSAEVFAEGAVRILNGLHVVDFLCFGSEAGENAILGTDSSLWEIASILAEESPEYRSALQASLKNGFSFPKARNEALLAVYPKLANDLDFNRFFSQPNNILGIEYCKALIRSHSTIRPAAVKRTGGHYHDTRLSEQFPSASAIREALKTASASCLKPYLPTDSYLLLKKNQNRTCPMTADDFSSFLHYALLQHEMYSGDFTVFADITPALSDKIRKQLPAYQGYSSFCQLLKTKDVTAARISRCLLHILLGITKEQLLAFRAPEFTGYGRILGFRKEAGELLSQLKKQAQIPLISKPANARHILNPAELSLFELETHACNIYNAAVFHKFGVSAAHEYTNSVLIHSLC